MSIEIPKIDVSIAEGVKEYEKTLEPLRSKNFNFSNSESSDYLNFPPSSLLALSDMADISRPVKVSSHRKYIGMIIVAGKTLLMRYTSPLIRLLFRRQIIFNENVVAMAHTVVAMESRINYLESLLIRRTKDEENKVPN